MMRILTILLALMVGVVEGLGDGAAPCSVSPGCSVGDGRYMALAPPDWDGRTPLPTLIFYHGWRESAEYTIAEPVLSAFAQSNQILLIAPHGMGNTWSYPGSPGKFRDELAFTEAMVADVKARFAVDISRFFAAGFSQGASMVWTLACSRPDLFTAFGALAGGFWEPSPTACSGRAVHLVHIHGTNDTTVPLGGRALRGGEFRQSDVRRDWSVWLKGNRCPSPADTSIGISGRHCERWAQCGEPKPLHFCTHDGGHAIHAGDLDAFWQLVTR